MTQLAVWDEKLDQLRSLALTKAENNLAYRAEMGDNTSGLHRLEFDVYTGENKRFRTSMAMGNFLRRLLAAHVFFQTVAHMMGEQYYWNDWRVITEGEYSDRTIILWHRVSHEELLFNEEDWK